MSSRHRSLIALLLSTVAVLGTLLLVYGLVYPSGAHGTKAPLAWAIGAGALGGLVAVFIGLGAGRRASEEPERFFALLAWVLGAFFLFVLSLGFGIPALFLGVHD